ncbi:hypothetical protein GQ600_9091 [Phytophthora cactorum]|nr:hypothetical protein GQ600_9091 [Phytophthora cactorum]
MPTPSEPLEAVQAISHTTTDKVCQLTVPALSSGWKEEPEDAICHPPSTGTKHVETEHIIIVVHSTPIHSLALSDAATFTIHRNLRVLLTHEAGGIQDQPDALSPEVTAAL